jgi:glycosyltransferase involved in cell wall biosynthesis
MSGVAAGNPVHPDLPTPPATCNGSTNGNADALAGDRVLPHFRVLKVTQSYYPFLMRGGPAVKVRALALGLARRGHRVTVLTSDLGMKDAAKPASTMQEASGWRCDEGGVEALYLSARGGYRSLTWNPSVFAFCAKSLKLVDIVHIYGTYDLLGPIIARACRKKGIPYLVEPMGMFRPMVRNLALKWLYRCLIGESVLRGAARVVATSPQEQKELIEEGIAAQQIVIRRNGVELPTNLPPPGAFRRQWQIPQEAFLVLFLGRIVSKKSPELLLESFARWQRSPETVQPAVLVFAGPAENKDRERLEAEAMRSHLGKTVLFTGPLYGDGKWSALADADIFVLPSQNENFGNAAVEAMACGTPVIVTDRCGIAPLIEGRAGFVIPHESKALVWALHQLSDMGLRERMKQGCIEVARGLGWEQPLDETEALYAGLLRSRNSTWPSHPAMQVQRRPTSRMETERAAPLKE